MRSHPGLTSGAASHPGRERPNNEDRYFGDARLGVFAVFDGLGGNNAGEVAAEIAAVELKARLSRPEGTVQQALREGITIANNKILQTARTSAGHEGMACVLTAAVISGDRVTIGHVGDSRAYLSSNGHLIKLTHDHSPIGEREDRGELPELDAMRHPRRYEIYRDVGTEHHSPMDPDFVEMMETAFGSRDVLLLCTDGLTDMVTSAQIQRVLGHPGQSASDAADSLVQLALDAGGRDNVTVVVVFGAEFGRVGIETPRLLTVAAGQDHLRRVIPFPAGIGNGSDRLPPAPSPPSVGRNLVPGWAPPVVGISLTLIGLLAYAFTLWSDSAAFEGPDRTPSAIPSTYAVLGVSEAPALQRVTEVIPVDPKMSLRDEIIRAPEGAILLLAPGVYLENIALRSHLHLVAAEAGTVILRPIGTPDRPMISAEKVAGASVVGLVLESGSEAVTGIRVEDSDVHLVALTFKGFGRAPVEVLGRSRPLLWNLQAPPGVPLVAVQPPAEPLVLPSALRKDPSGG